MKNWDYNKLFEEGNYIGVKNERTGQVYYHLIHEDNPFLSYRVDKLKSGDWVVWRIIQLNDNGEITDVLFDRERDYPRPMPKLKTGMFVRVQTDSMREDDEPPTLGVIINDRVIYDNSGESCYTGGWDSIDENETDNVIEDIVTVYSDEARCFCGCISDRIIWEK